MDISLKKCQVEVAPSVSFQTADLFASEGAVLGVIGRGSIGVSGLAGLWSLSLIL